MLDRALWLDRRFRFDVPNSLFPNVVERVRGTPARLDARVKHLAPAVLTARTGGRWSIQENVGHLVDVELLWLCRTEELLGGAERLTPADLSNAKTESARHNERDIAELLQTFRGHRARIVEHLDGASDEALARAALHERLGVRMRLIDHAVFMAEHDDHHLATITRLLK